MGEKKQRINNHSGYMEHAQLANIRIIGNPEGGEEERAKSMENPLREILKKTLLVLPQI